MIYCLGLICLNGNFRVWCWVIMPNKRNGTRDCGGWPLSSGYRSRSSSLGWWCFRSASCADHEFPGMDKIARWRGKQSIAESQARFCLLEFSSYESENYHCPLAFRDRRTVIVLARSRTLAPQVSRFWTCLCPLQTMLTPEHWTCWQTN